MKFKSRKDLFMKIFTIGMCGFLATILLIRINVEGYNNLNFIFLDSLILVVIGFLLWLYFGTEYELTETELKHKSGPVKGSMKIEKITEIIVGGTLWAGVKPATALNGLIVKVGGFDEIYISPKTNESFTHEILKLNKNIKITRK